ncbi:MAG: phosphate ABC transporter permease subunit PstC [Nisaea sp.]|jgi:phosphate transport system permease protein|uniref:phosphate ABC transporter permease subunit PstC n=1 Tax=Nisaea sp. TaxID=2024842 RepID=UPI001B1C3795|nr:phosphate ABC transporter permease subunit PstC [Nisaea sp.]MBO6560495.1 phosphate ABC transporter permease subunit PstC [Nisaea sp.]
MNSFFLLLVVIGLSVAGYAAGRARSVLAASGDVRILHSLPSYYGMFVALGCGLPAILLLALWLIIQPQIVEHMVMAGLDPSIMPQNADEYSLMLTDIRNLASGNAVSREASPAIMAAMERYQSLQSVGFWTMGAAVVCIALLGLVWARSQVSRSFRARNVVENIIRVLLIVCSMIAILTTVGIVLSLIFESLRFFARVPFFEFLFGIHWSPQTAIRAEQVGASGSFGAVPLFAGTMLITLIAMLVAGPIGLLSAIYMAEYANPKFRAIAKPMLEILAGIPTVVYGFFAALTVAPLIRGWGESIGLDVASESALAAGVVMGIMIIPFVSSLSDDVINSVPQSLRDGSYGLGATKSETIRHVIIPAALPGIVGAFLLAVSRAIGETMIVVMAAGLAANLTANPLEAVTTVTVQIVTLLVGDQEFDSAKTLAAFALGLVLFFVTLGLNVIALRVVRKYREKYD